MYNEVFGHNVNEVMFNRSVSHGLSYGSYLDLEELWPNVEDSDKCLDVLKRLSLVLFERLLAVHQYVTNRFIDQYVTVPNSTAF